MTEFWAHTILAALSLFVYSLMLGILFNIIDKLIRKGDDDDDDE